MRSSWGNNFGRVTDIALLSGYLYSAPILDPDRDCLPVSIEKNH